MSAIRMTVVGRSLAIVAFLSFLFALDVYGAVVINVNPGDSGSIQIPISNDIGSILPLKGVRLNVIASSTSFIIQNTSVLGHFPILWPADPLL